VTCRSSAVSPVATPVQSQFHGISSQSWTLTLRSLPRCSCQDQGTHAGRLAPVEQAADDCVELVSGGARRRTPGCRARVCGQGRGRPGPGGGGLPRPPLLGKAPSGRLSRCPCLDDRRRGADVEDPAPVITGHSGRPDDCLDVARARLGRADEGRVRDDQVGRIAVGVSLEPADRLAAARPRTAR